MYLVVPTNLTCAEVHVATLLLQLERFIAQNRVLDSRLAEFKVLPRPFDPPVVSAESGSLGWVGG